MSKGEQFKSGDRSDENETRSVDECENIFQLGERTQRPACDKKPSGHLASAKSKADLLLLDHYKPIGNPLLVEALRLGRQGKAPPKA